LPILFKGSMRIIKSIEKANVKLRTIL